MQGMFAATWFAIAWKVAFIGFSQTLVFGVLEVWPKRFPTWLARWVSQLIAVALITPFAAALLYSLTNFSSPMVWMQFENKLNGFGIFTGVGILVSPWIAMSALYRQISGHAQQQALSFDLERSEFERNALDSRLRLLQAQVEPHFLF